MNYGLARLDGAPPLTSSDPRDPCGASTRRAAARRQRSVNSAAPSELDWVPSGASLQRATFVPPPVPEMKEALSDFEKFLHSEDTRQPGPRGRRTCSRAVRDDPSVPRRERTDRSASDHPASWSSGRGASRRPLLYLSLFLQCSTGRSTTTVSWRPRLRGDWEGWLRFFLTGRGRNG